MEGGKERKEKSKRNLRTITAFLFLGIQGLWFRETLILAKGAQPSCHGRVIPFSFAK